MKEYTVYQARTHLSKLLREVAGGEEVVITSGRARKRVAKFSRIEESTPPSIGFAKDRLELSPELSKLRPEDDSR